MNNGIKRTLGFYVTLEVEGVDDKFLKDSHGNDTPFEMDEITKERQKYRKCVGKVIRIGSQAYKGDKFFNEPWVEVGQRVLFNPNSFCHRMVINGKYYLVLPDDALLEELEDDAIVSPW